MDKEPLTDVLARMSQLEQKLKESGVPLDVIPNVMEYIDEYSVLKENLGQARDRQFTNEAYELSEALRGKNGTERASAWLRKFAERIAKHAVWSPHKHHGNIDMIVDSFASEEEKEDESE